LAIADINTGGVEVDMLKASRRTILLPGIFFFLIGELLTLCVKESTMLFSRQFKCMELFQTGSMHHTKTENSRTSLTYGLWDKRQCGFGHHSEEHRVVFYCS